MDNPDTQIYFWTRTLFVCGLLGAGGMMLALERAGTHRFASRVLVGMAVLSALAAGMPLWIPYPHIDYMVPVVPFSVLSIVAGVLVGLLSRRVRKGHGPSVALVISGSLALLYALLTEVDVLTVEHRSGGGQGLYVLPAAIAGALLGWLVTSHQDDRAFYVVGWAVVTVMWLLLHYTVEVAALENAHWYATHGMNDRTIQAARLAQVGQKQPVAALAYLAGSLLLLALPFIRKGDPNPSRPQDAEQTANAVRAGSQVIPLE